MAKYPEQPGLEVGSQPNANDKFIPGALLQGYSTAAMAHASTNFHPATEGHALHLASEGNTNGQIPFSDSPRNTPNPHPFAEGYISPAYSSPHSAQASSSPSKYSIVPPTPENNSPSGYIPEHTGNRQHPSDFSRSNSGHSADKLQIPQQITTSYAPSNFSGLPGPYGEKGKPARTICGLGLATFWWLLALVTVILVAAIGGGVGGTIAVSNAKKEAAVSASVLAAAVASASASNSKQNASPSLTLTSAPTGVAITSVITSNIPASTTSTSSSATFTADPSPKFIPLDCTSPRQFTIGGTYQNTFDVTCNQDFSPPVISGNNDIIALTVYSVGDCLRACASYNRNIGSGNQCKGAAFDANWSAVNKDGGNCWLKNTTSTLKGGSSTQAVILLQT